jgi:hypothetical protein
MVLIKAEKCLDVKGPSFKEMIERRKNCKEIFALGVGKVTFEKPTTVEENIPVELPSEKEAANILAAILSNQK